MKSKLLIATALLIITVVSWLSCMNSSDSGSQALPDKVSYNFNIRPI